jgi:predicted nucleic acid-binding Zn ribbon protein
MTKKTTRFFLLNVTAVLLIFSCVSKPEPADSGISDSKVTDSGSQVPSQAMLDELDAAMARAQSGREKAAAVQAQVYFPDEWNKAESDNNAGKDSNKGTVEGVRQGIALFTSAASGYEAIAGNAGPLFAKDQEEANSALQAAMARAEKSRQDAMNANGQTYFANDWRAAEAKNTSAKDAKTTTADEVKAATALYVSAADAYDDIAIKSRQAAARETEDADKALQAAMARAEKSRQDAMNANGQTYFANDWRAAETKNTSAKNAKRTTAAEIKAATALFVSAADAYDDVARKSQQALAKETDDANKALQAAIARTDKSRQDAMNAGGQTYFANDWRAAETKNTSAKNAKRTTTAEIKAATALFVSAADAYDDVARKSQQALAKEKDDAAKALQAAMARTEKSRKDAQDAKGNVNFPADWNNAETKNRTAGSAKRATVAEIKAAVPLYVSAADAYDDIVRKNAVFMNEQDQNSAADARTRAQQERQKALDVKADIAVAAEFNGADMFFKQASNDFDKKTFTSAVELYNKAADQFIAAALSAEKKRTLANETVGEAKQKSAQSADYAINTGIALEGMNETI